jgi:phage repressor protein C with HTH and peptisase S24 domain
MKMDEVQSSKVTNDCLRYWLRVRGLKQEDLAEDLGISQSHISNMIHGRRGISADVLQKIVDALDITIPEFFLRDGFEKPDTVYISRLSARPRAGTGGLETDAEYEGVYAFHSSFVERKGGSPQTMKIFQVAGDSMTPILDHGDLIMINEKEIYVRSGLIYLLRLEDEIMVKRLENRPGELLVLKSDNTRYTELIIDKKDESINYQIFGRMVWSCREY